MNQEPLPVDLSDLEMYFAQKPSAAPKEPAATEREQKEPLDAPADGLKDSGRLSTRRGTAISLIDTKRANNMAIMMSQLKLPPASIKQAILELDDSLLSADHLTKIITVFPNEEELSVLSAFKGDVGDLAKPESFFVQLLEIRRCRQKVGCFLYKLIYDMECDALRAAVATVTLACNEVISSKRFLRVLETVLAVGNFLNRGTAKGNALGFKLDTLNKLLETKSVTQQGGITTLLHYIVSLVQQNMSSLLQFHEDLPHLEGACKSSVSSLLEQYRELKEGLGRVRRESSACANETGSDAFRDKIKAFLTEADSKFALLEQDIKDMSQSLTKVVHSFGEDQESAAEDLLQSVLKFIQAFQACAKDLEREKDKGKAKRPNPLSRPGSVRVLPTAPRLDNSNAPSRRGSIATAV